MPTIVFPVTYYTVNNNLTTDERIELYSNPLYGTNASDHSLQRVLDPGNSCNSQQIEAPCGAESIRDERSLRQIIGFSIQKDTNGAQTICFQKNQQQSDESRNT